MGKRGPKSFSEDFRREAVRLVAESNRSVKELAAELGVSVTTLRVWMRQVPKAANTRGQVLSLEEENRRLRKENERLREEREILKKATAFFAKGAR
jgi:transposase